MYQSIKNILLKPSRKKEKKCRRRTELHDRRVSDGEPDVRRQVTEGARRRRNHSSPRSNVSDDDVRHPADESGADESRVSVARIDAAVEVHVVASPRDYRRWPGATPLHSTSALATSSPAAASSPGDVALPSAATPGRSDGRSTTPPSATAADVPAASARATAAPLEAVVDFFHRFADLRTDVRVMMANGAVVYLLGTNHADPQCPVDVANIIRRVGPQLVVIELCAWRACGCPLHRGNVFQTKPEFTFRYLRRVISQIGFLPAMIFFTDAFNEQNAVAGDLLDYGGEFAVAARLCEQLDGCKILLGDREIPITVKRQAAGMGNWRGIRVATLVTLALIFKRRMKGLLMRGHRLVIRDPRFYQIVVLERDIFLTYMIQVAAAMKHDARQPQIVAVVGQGHLNGIQRFWGRILPQILPIILEPDMEF